MSGKNGAQEAPIVVFFHQEDGPRTLWKVYISGLACVGTLWQEQVFGITFETTAPITELQIRRRECMDRQMDIFLNYKHQIPLLL